MDASEFARIVEQKLLLGLHARKICFCGQGQTFSEGMSKKQVIKEKFDAFLLRRKFIPAFELTEESLKKLVKKLNKYKPNIHLSI